MTETNGHTELHAAALADDVDEIKRLVDAGEEINSMNEKNNSPLHVAAVENNVNSVRELTKLGANTEVKDKQGMTPLHKAVILGFNDVIVSLLEAGADVHAKDIRDVTPIFWPQSAAIAKILIEKGAEVNAKTAKGISPLHWVAWNGYTEMVNVLVEAGAELNAKDRYGQTPLHSAILSRNINCINALLDKGADVNSKDNKNNTPLMTAASEGFVSIIKLLVDAKANVHDKNKEESNPLHFAVVKNNIDAVKYLIKKGANPHEKNKIDFTPLQVAESMQHVEIVHFIKNINSNTHKNTAGLSTSLKGLTIRIIVDENFVDNHQISLIKEKISETLDKISRKLSLNRIMIKLDESNVRNEIQKILNSSDENLDIRINSDVGQYAILVGIYFSHTIEEDKIENFDPMIKSLPSMEEYFSNSVTTIFWMVNEGDEIKPKNGTAFFWDTGKKILAVTAEHVLKGYENDLSKLNLNSKLGNVNFDLVKRNSAKCSKYEIATFEMTDDEIKEIKKIKGIGSKPHKFAFCAKTHIPQLGDEVMVLGFPGVQRDDLDSKNFTSTLRTFNGILTHVDEKRMELEVNPRDYIYGYEIDTHQDKNNAFSGLSGGPVLMVDKSGPVDLLKLCGIITGLHHDNYINSIHAARIDLIDTDGSIKQFDSEKP